MTDQDLNDTAKPQRGTGNQQNSKFTNTRWVTVGAFIAVAIVLALIFA